MGEGSNVTESSHSQYEGYDRAIELLHDCCSEDGFLATPNDKYNYRRIWARDSSIMGLAALLSGRQELIAGCKQGLLTLIRYQGPHGEIPSNIDPAVERVSYGGTAGRVDADLWFVICCGEYWKVTNDEEFLQQTLEPLEKVRFLLGAWEMNTRGLLYVPPTGDWADEYLQSGYVLYDQLLYLQAQQVYCSIHHHIHGSANHELEERVARLKHLIQANYWFRDEYDAAEDAYHEVLYEKGRKAAPHRGGVYWLPFFSPVGYGYRFDAMANSLVMLLGVASDAQCEEVDDYIAKQIVHPEVMLLPAFDPVITPQDEGWDELQMTFSYKFKNEPYEYHNGGLWPLVTAFYSASLARRGKQELARKYCEAIHSCNQRGNWSFAEYLHGRNHTPQGTQRMGWSAASAVIAEQYLRGSRLFETSEISNSEEPQDSK